MGVEEVASLVFVLKAKDEATQAFNHVRDKAKEVGEEGHGMGGGFMAGGLLVGAGVGIAATAVAGFAIDGAKHTMDVGQAAYEMGERFGMSGQQASTWIGIGAQVGIGAEDISRSFTRMDRSMASAAQAQEAANKTGKASHDVYSQLGIQLEDASGKMKSQSEIITEVSEKFKAMPDGPEKTAAAMQIFGKAGADMLPMLNEGKEGLDKLTKAAQDNGSVLSDDQVKAAHDAEMAHKRLDAAISALSMNIGNAVLPVFTAFTNIMMNNVIPAVREMLAWLGDKLHPVFVAVGGVIGTVVAFVQQLFGAFSGGKGASDTMQMQMSGVGQAASILSGLFHGVVDVLTAYFVPAFQQVAAFLTGTVIPAVQQIAQAVLTNLMPPLMALGKYIVTDVLPALKLAADFLMQNVVPVIRDFLTNAIHALVDVFINRVMPIVREVIIIFRDDLWPVLLAVGKFIMEQFVPPLMQIAQVMTALVGPAISFIGGLLGAVLGPILDFIHQHFKAIVIVLGIVAAGFLIVAAPIVALIAVGLLLLRHWQDIERIAGEVVGAVVGFFQGMLDSVSGIFGGIGHAIGAAMAAVLTVIKAYIALWLDVYVKWPLAILEALAGFASKIWGFLSGEFATILGYIKTAIDLWLDVYVRFPLSIITALAGFAGRIWGFLSGELSSIGGSIAGAVTGYVKFWIDMPGRILSALSGLGGAIAGVFGGIWGTISSAVTGLVTSITSTLGGIATGIGNIFGGIGRSIGGGIRNGIDAMIDIINPALKGMGDLGFDGHLGVPGFHVRDLFGGAMPQIPRLAFGGIVMPQEGGTIIRVAEAGYPEAIVPLPAGMGAVGSSTAAAAAHHGGDVDVVIPITLTLDGHVLTQIVTRHQARDGRLRGIQIGAAS